jgi:tRNA (guanine-N7-)-methyltransferase
MTAAIRTYNARRGRLRPGRLDALTRLLPRYGWDQTRVDGSVGPVVLEIGSGMGEATVAMAAADPERLYLAVEVHTAGVANLLSLIERADLRNVRVVRGDAVALLRERVAPGALDAIHAFFPDPWPKPGHHKRRLIQPSHVELMVSRLRVGGRLHCATDDRSYADAMLATLTAAAGLRNLAGDGFAPRPAHRPVTRFEQRGLAAGRTSLDLLFERVPT